MLLDATRCRLAPQVSAARGAAGAGGKPKGRGEAGWRFGAAGLDEVAAHADSGSLHVR